MLRLLRFRLLLSLPSPLSPILSGAAVALCSGLLTRLVVLRTLHGLSFTSYRTLSGTKTKQEARLLKIAKNLKEFKDVLETILEEFAVGKRIMGDPHPDKKRKLSYVEGGFPTWACVMDIWPAPPQW